MKECFVVIGADAAGMSAASKARRENNDLQIIVLEKGRWASYAACGLPYYIKGDVQNLEDLVAITPETFRKDRRIDLRLEHEVSRINPEKKELTVNTKDGQINLAYDKLLISTGARAIKPKIEGIGSEGVFTLRDMDSAKKIKDHIEEHSTDSTLIIGGGYIGIEMAEALSSRGISIEIVELFPHVLHSFGPEISEVVESHLKKYATLHLGKSVQSIKYVSHGRRLSVKIGDETNQEKILTDMVIVAAGIAPEVTLAKEAGIQLGETGAIAIDEYGRTNIPGIYAAGDCVEVKHIVTGKTVYIPLALTANRHGRAVGSTVGGRATLLAPIAGTAVVKVFQLEVAITGITNPEVARKHGFSPVKVTIDSHSRAGYCPGSKSIKISLLADGNSKKLLGASMVGEEGVAKRIDIIATALGGHFSVEQLENLDLAYAPPFSPVWDPVLAAARVLNGKLTD